MITAYFYNVDTLELIGIAMAYNYNAIDQYYKDSYDSDVIGYQFSKLGLIDNAVFIKHLE
jgi:hypothetical protein